MFTAITDKQKQLNKLPQDVTVQLSIIEIDPIIIMSPKVNTSWFPSLIGLSHYKLILGSDVPLDYILIKLIIALERQLVLENNIITGWVFYPLSAKFQFVFWIV